MERKQSFVYTINSWDHIVLKVLNYNLKKKTIHFISMIFFRKQVFYLDWLYQINDKARVWFNKT